MTNIVMALLVTDAKKAAVEAAIAALQMNYTIGFARGCTDIANATATWQTPPSHWYMHDGAVDTSIVNTINLAVDGNLPDGFTPPSGTSVVEILTALSGLGVYTAQNIDDATVWANKNLEAQGLKLLDDYDPNSE